MRRPSLFLLISILACSCFFIEIRADTPGFLDNLNLDFLIQSFAGGGSGQAKGPTANPAHNTGAHAASGKAQQTEEEEEEESSRDGKRGGGFRTKLASVLEIGRALLLNGVPHGTKNVTNVSLDPLKLPDLHDPAHKEPHWSISGIQISGLLGLQIESVKLTETTISAELSFPALSGQVELNVMDAQFRPTLALQVDKPRVVVTAQYGYSPQGGFQVSNFTPLFLNDGVALSVKDVSQLASWNPLWG